MQQDRVEYPPRAWICVAESHLPSNQLAQDLVQVNCKSQGQTQVAFPKGTSAGSEIKFS